MMRHIIIYVFFATMLLGAIPLANASFAATLLFDPTTITTNPQQTFTVNVNVNAGSDKITSTDAYILYDQNLLEIQSIANGTFFPTVSKNTTTGGKVYIAGMVNDPATSKTGSGTIATITFKAKANGTVTLRYDCTQGSTTDSNVTKNDLNATDIIVCANNGTSTVTVETGTSSPTATPGAGGTNPTAELPKSGVFDNVIKFAIPGAILFLLGVIAKLSLI